MGGRNEAKLLPVCGGAEIEVLHRSGMGMTHIMMIGEDTWSESLQSSWERSNSLRDEHSAGTLTVRLQTCSVEIISNRIPLIVYIYGRPTQCMR